MSENMIFLPFLFLFMYSSKIFVCGEPKAFIHIGPHKTGSTSFQTNLARISRQLENENLYALEFGGGVKGMGKLVTVLREKVASELLKFKSLLMSHRSANHNVIISSENLSK